MNTHYTTVDEVSTSYCHYLISKQKYLWSISKKKDMTTEHFRAIIFKIIKPAPMTDKKVKFYSIVRELDTKEDIAKFVSNSCRKATNTYANLEKIK